MKKASSKKYTQFKTRVQKPALLMTKTAKIDGLYITKPAVKTCPL